MRYYKTSEYNKLTKEQKAELREWRQNNSQGGSSDHSDRKKFQKPKKLQKQVASLVSKQLETELKKLQSDANEKMDQEAYIKAIVSQAMSDKIAEASKPTAPPTTKQVSLQSILKMSRNGTSG